MKYHFVQQHGEEDCGAACLASIAQHHRLKLSLRAVRDRVGTGHNGTNLWGLQQGASQLGFNTRSVRADLSIIEQLSEIPLPAILHWQGNHWVVLYGKQGRRFIIVDPAIGVRQLTQPELLAGWQDGVMLLLEPDAARFSSNAEPPPTGMGRIAQRLWVYRSLLVQAIGINVVVGLLALASPMLLQILTDDVLIRGDFKLLNTVAVAVMGLILISNSLELVQANLIAHFAQRLELGLVLEFCQQILRLPLSYYEARRSGEIISRLQDIQQLNYLVSQVIVNLPSQFFVAILSFCLMLFYSWKLSVIAIGVAIAMMISVILFQPALKRKTQAVLVADADNQGTLVETFKGALTLKTLAAYPQLWDEFQGRFSRMATLNLRTQQIGILNNTFSGLVASLGGIGLLWMGGTLVMNPSDNFSVGQLLAFKALSDNVTHLISTVINFVDEFTRVRAAAQRLAEVTETQPEDDQLTGSTKPTAKISAHAAIRCTALSFDYPGRTNLLSDLTVEMPGGLVTAIVGQSGCGKSTLAKLIAALYMPQTGNIQIGAYNQQDLNLHSLRQQVVLIPQEPHFWNRSILENFRLGAPNANFEQIVSACQLAGAAEFIGQLPQTYQTVLGEFATNLSGGQRQRLAIARALLGDPAILILDEATSGLDPASEALLMDRVLQHRQGKTTVLISHRPTVIARADWVIMLEQGRLKVQGARAQVLEIVNRQLESLTA